MSKVFTFYSKSSKFDAVGQQCSNALLLTTRAMREPRRLSSHVLVTFPGRGIIFGVCMQTETKDVKHLYDGSYVKISSLPMST